MYNFEIFHEIKTHKKVYVNMNNITHIKTEESFDPMTKEYIIHSTIYFGETYIKVTDNIEALLW